MILYLGEILDGILDGVLDDVYDIILDGLYILDGNADGSGLFVNGVYFETLTFFCAYTILYNITIIPHFNIFIYFLIYIGNLFALE